MKRFLWLAIFVGSILCVPAQESKQRTIDLWGHVKSAYIKQGILGAKVTLMTEDSTVVDSMRVFQEWHGDNKIDAAYKFVIPAVRKRYIIRAEHPDYEPLDVNFSVPPIGRNTLFEATYHFLKPRRQRFDLEGGMLGEVVVAKTRIKVFTRGDTLIYNADAFKLPEGSMLDDLIKQLPGAELKADGQIFVNGEKIEELTLNGKNFFGNNAKVMLENLPHYTVNQLKVFRKNTDRNEWLGREVEEKRLAMDVVLKREYSVGTLVNAALGGATDELWLARLFALRYTDNSRTFAYANGNNINAADRPDRDGDWYEGAGGTGRNNVRTAGLDLMIDDADKRWQENLTAKFTSKKNDTQTVTSSENYLASGSSVFGRMVSSQQKREVGGEVNNYFKTIDSRNPWHSHLNLGAWFGHQRDNGHGRQVQTAADPGRWGGAESVLDSVFAARLNPDLQRMLVNRSVSQSRADNRAVGGWADAGLWHKTSWGDDGGVNLRGSLTREHGHSYDQQSVDFAATPFAHNRYGETFPNRTYDYAVAPYYNFSLLHGWNLYADYTFNQHFYAQGNGAYLLDRLAGYDANGNNLGQLPSTRDSLLLATDADNSNRQRGLKRTHALATALTYSHKRLWARLNLTLRHQDDRVDYSSAPLDTTLRQRRWTLEPDLNIRHERQARGDSAFSRRWTLRLQRSTSLPSLLMQIPVRNDKDPLNVRLGNPDLRPTHHYAAEAQVSGYRSKPYASYMLSASASVSAHSLSQGYTYDALTGVYTHRPQNVDGNWSAGANGRWLTTFGRQHWQLMLRAGEQYSRNVDYAALAGSADARLSHVDNWYADGGASLAYRGNKNLWIYSITASSSVGYRHAHQREATIGDVNAVTVVSGVNGSVDYRRLTFTTDLSLHTSRGSGDASFDRDDLIWNASLSCRLLKGRLSARLTAADLLRQLSVRSVVVNGQGRTEVWTNTLPRYVMLTMNLRLQKFPKSGNSGRVGRDIQL